jgi:hypothetical protein
MYTGGIPVTDFEEQSYLLLYMLNGRRNNASSGFDGFVHLVELVTPVQPQVIPAQEVQPGSVRARLW